MLEMWLVTQQAFGSGTQKAAKRHVLPFTKNLGGKKKDLINGKLGLIELGMLASAEMH